VTARFIPPANPWEPPPLDDAELLALKSLSAGKANAFQQQLALTTIVKKLACSWDMSFRPGGAEGARATDFAEGRRFVGARIVEAIERPMKPSKEISDGRPSTDADTGEAAGRRNPKPGRPKSKPSKPDATGWKA
jgi:hypothetical protein